MKAILNHQTIDREKIPLTAKNRGFVYGDGFFETISVISGSPRFLDQHLNRLKKAAMLMKMETTDLLQENKIASEVSTLLEVNGIGVQAKLKIYMWRESSGLYSPQGSDVSVLLTVDPASAQGFSVAANAGFSEKVFNFPTPYSPFKTMSALKYVLAGIEKDDRKLDEIFLLDHLGNVSEALYANVFWKKSGAYFTPPLSTGCIDGIMKNWFMGKMQQRGLSVRESLVVKDAFLSAECVFITNSSGIKHIRQIDGVDFEVDQQAEDLLRSIS